MADASVSTEVVGTRDWGRAVCRNLAADSPDESPLQSRERSDRQCIAPGVDWTFLQQGRPVNDESRQFSLAQLAIYVAWLAAMMQVTRALFLMEYASDRGDPTKWELLDIGLLCSLAASGALVGGGIGCFFKRRGVTYGAGLGAALALILWGMIHHYHHLFRFNSVPLPEQSF